MGEFLYIYQNEKNLTMFQTPEALRDQLNYRKAYKLHEIIAETKNSVYFCVLCSYKWLVLVLRTFS